MSQRARLIVQARTTLAMDDDAYKWIAWNEPRWSYIPGLWKDMGNHFSIKRMCFLIPLNGLLLAAYAWKEGQPIPVNTVAGLLALLGGAIVLHLIFSLVILVLIWLRWALPFHAAMACKVLGLRIRFRYGIGESDFDRCRLVVFSPNIVRLRAFAGKRSVATGVPTNVDLEQLAKLLPGDLQVWDVRKRARHTIRRDVLSGEVRRCVG